MESFYDYVRTKQTPSIMEDHVTHLKALAFALALRLLHYKLKFSFTVQLTFCVASCCVGSLLTCHPWETRPCFDSQRTDSCQQLWLTRTDPPASLSQPSMTVSLSLSLCLSVLSLPSSTSSLSAAAWRGHASASTISCLLPHPWSQIPGESEGANPQIKKFYKSYVIFFCNWKSSYFK